jgi:hypothetical protein
MMDMTKRLTFRNSPQQRKDVAVDMLVANI